MLEHLTIRNYAIIEELSIHFNEGLNIITGETGAGKSILVGALGLILGDRADTSVLFAKNQKCIVEGLFSVEGKKEIQAFLESNDLESFSEIILRREIATNGKSRAFINDTPVNLSQLQELSILLVDLHQQFDAREMTENQFQLGVLDTLAKTSEQRLEYQEHFKKFTDLTNLLAEKKREQEKSLREQDFDQFIFSELETAAFREMEIETLETELKQLTHAGQIKSVLSKVCYELKESEEPVVSRLRGLESQLATIADYHPRIPELAARLRSAELELRDIAEELEQEESKVRVDEEALERLNERLNLAYKLMKKHGVQRTAELVDIQNTLEEKLAGYSNLNGEIEILEKQLNQEKEKAVAEAKVLSKLRRAEIPSFEKKVNGLLAKVGMPNARLKVDHADAGLNLFGMDRICFLFDANKSGRFEPLKKVASGGELSRLMLCIKSLVASSVELSTLIFDEIDTGISGEAAKQVGILMKELANHIQVISITHQPQIAAMADTHFLVFKREQLGHIKTGIRELSTDDRVLTIAQMIGGEQPGEAAMANARELMAGHPPAIEKRK